MNRKTGIAIGGVVLLGILCLRYALLLKENRDALAQAELLQAQLATQTAKTELLQTKLTELQEKLTEQTAAIADYQTTTTILEQQLAVCSSLEETRTKTGFVKKGGVYLLNSSSDLYTLNRLILNSSEIEPGVAASEGSYRLQNDLDMGNSWFYIGTDELPFRGSFDGDGHCLNGCFFGLESHEAQAIFRTGDSAEIQNLYISDQMNQSPQLNVNVSIIDETSCAAFADNLLKYPDCQVSLTLRTGDSDTQRIADSLRARWERNHELDSYQISVYFTPELINETDKMSATAIIPFYSLAGEEWRSIIENAAAEENGYLRYLRLERIGTLDCYSFEIAEPDSRYDHLGEGYHILLQGEWEGTQVQPQHFYIPYTDNELYSIGYYSSYRLECVDLNFDGKQDLLIHEGASGGSGGSWGNYRAIVWDTETNAFAYYPSFPEQLVVLQFDRQRMISRGDMGLGYEYVTVYGVVNGEYVCTQELVLERKYDSETKENISLLSYYEMGELVRTHLLSDDEEPAGLYPDLDYWQKG